MTKYELLQHVVETLKKEIENAKQNLESTKKAAADAPGAMESHSDTTKSQMSRLAEEMQYLISEKSLALHTLQSVAYSGLPSSTGDAQIGSVVEVLTEHNEREFYLILPAGGGTEVSDNHKTVCVVTPRAPLAAALMGKRQGQTIKLRIGPQQRELTIVSVQ